MAKKHVHNWKYNKVKEVLVNNMDYQYFVRRFCTECFITNSVELTSENERGLHITFDIDKVEFITKQS